MSDTTDPLKQLARWWKDAEKGIVGAGDTVILRNDDDTYKVYPATSDDVQEYDHIRILSRAPIPKPAWHDAVAVIAHAAGWERRRVLTRHEGVTASGNTIWSCGALNYAPADLINPVPLIEARVTDEMVERAVDEYEVRGSFFAGKDRIRGILAAALGVDE